MTNKRASVLMAVVTLSFAGSSIATAQQPRPHGEPMYEAPQLSSVNNPYSDYPAAEVQAVPAAKARAAIAAMELLRAQADLSRGTRAAVRSFKSSDESSKATAEQSEAYKQYQAARERALQPLQSDAEYQAAQVMKDKLRAQIADAHEQAAAVEKPVLHEIIAMATIKLRYSVQASNREAAMLRDSAEVREARTKLVSAAGRVSGLRERFSNDLRDDPDLIAARRAVFDQKVAHVASQTYLAGLKEARGIALDYAYWVRRHNPYRVMGYDPYGFNRSYYSYGNGSNGGQGY